MDNEICENCFYYNEKYKECRRYPPGLIMVAQEVLPTLEIGGSQRPLQGQARVQYGFPKIMPKWWCGEWTPQEEVKK